MPLKRTAACTVALLLGLATAPSAQAEKAFSLSGGGGQTHIGNGLMIPIQQAATSLATTGTMFPNLRVGARVGKIVTGTVVKPLLGPISGKTAYQRKLTVPKGALTKPGGQLTVGVHFSNPTVYAVGTNLRFSWPAAPAVFSSGAVGPAVISGYGGTMTYSNALGTRFGGAAAFSISAGSEPAGLISPYAVTIYAKPSVGGAVLPCTHPAFGGANTLNNNGCAAGILIAQPTGTGAIGRNAIASSPGGFVAGKNVAILKLGSTPLGNVLIKALAATNTAVPSNAATSQGGPWTTGKVVISNPAALGGTEKFVLEGKDSRTANGGGTIQMVSGSVSNRVTTGPNANRGWVRLILASPAAVPSMSVYGLAATVALMLLAVGYANRRRLFA